MINSEEQTTFLSELVKLLKVGNPVDRHLAAKALGQSKQMEAVPALIEILQDGRSWFGVRMSCARALGELGDAKAILHLTIALGDKDLDVRQAVAKALEKLGQGDVGKSFIRLLEKYPIKDSLVIPLEIETAINNVFEDSDNQSGACYAIGYLQLTSFAPRLLSRLRMPSSRYYAKEIIFALGRLRYEPAIQELNRYIEDQSLPIKLAAIQALGEIHHPDSINLLIELLDNLEACIRIESLQALSHYVDKEAVQAVINHLPDQNRVVRAVAGKTLIKMGEFNLGQACLDALVGNPERLIALKKGRENLIPVLTAGLNDEIDFFHQASIISLSKISLISIPYLMKIYNDSNQRVKKGVISIINKIDDIKSVPELINGFQNPSTDVKLAIATTLSKFGTAILDTLFVSLSAKDINICAGAIITLGKIQDSRSIPRIQKTVLNKGSDIVRVANQAIVQICKKNEESFSTRRENCVCRNHSTRFNFQPVNSKRGYYACRVCNRSDPEIILEPVKKIVAVLGMNESQPNTEVLISEDGILRVPWKAGKGLFDFSAISLISNDFDDEGFVLEYLNDDDSYRAKIRSASQQIPIRIAPGILLQPSKRYRLQDHFEII